MTITKYIMVYHETETQAHRAYKPRPGETVSYRSIKEWDEKENEKFDSVLDLTASKKSQVNKSNEAKLKLGKETKS